MKRWMPCPPRSVWRSASWRNAFRWLGFVQGAPALATLLLGLGFLGGNFRDALPGGARAEAARRR